MSTTHKRVVAVEVDIYDTTWRVSVVDDRNVRHLVNRDTEQSVEAGHEAANRCAESLGPLWKPEGEGT